LAQTFKFLKFDLRLQQIECDVIAKKLIYTRGGHRGVSRGFKRGTISRSPNHYGGAESLRGRRKVPTVSQVHCLIQYICFRKTSGSNMGASHLLLAPGAI